jgi:hypothetical protein
MLEPIFCIAGSTDKVHQNIALHFHASVLVSFKFPLTGLKYLASNCC